MHTHSADLPFRPSSKSRDAIYTSFTHVFDASQTNTDAVIAESLRKTYPNLHLIISSTYSVNYLAFAASGQATAVPVDSDDALTANLKWKFYAQPAKRMDGGEGALGEEVQFGKYIYTWNGKEYLLYIVLGMQGSYQILNSYLLGPSKEASENLMLAAGHYASELHDEILVFDSGYWQKSHDLWKSVENSTWDDVILDEGMKKAIMGEIHKFFDSKERYARLKVPWKRGIIYYGPPGNGKTISIKATMHALSRLQSPIPTLYVRSLSSYAGPEYAISAIFRKARQFAPCYLIFEDLDSIVTDSVRSYFLNEVDGLESNDGILMIGSTNHLEKLDPGISKRPSRFDRKYLFPNPDEAQRVEYCKFWRKKLDGSEDVEFPEVLDGAIASITDGFSFAYMQEAFVASLLAIAGEADDARNELDMEKQEESESKKGQEVAEEMVELFKIPPPKGPMPLYGPGWAKPWCVAFDSECKDLSKSSTEQVSETIKESLDLRGIEDTFKFARALWEHHVSYGQVSQEERDIGFRQCFGYFVRRALIQYNNSLQPPKLNMPPKEIMDIRLNGMIQVVKGCFDLKVPKKGNKYLDEIYRDVWKVESGLDKYILWRQIKKQVEILRKELEQHDDDIFDD